MQGACAPNTACKRRLNISKDIHSNVFVPTSADFPPEAKQVMRAAGPAPGLKTDEVPISRERSFRRASSLKIDETHPDFDEADSFLKSDTHATGATTVRNGTRLLNMSWLGPPGTRT